MIYDIGIIGSGVAGTFAAYKIAQDHKDVKCIVFEGGRPPGKRRLQMTGFLGLLPNSDGKLYLNDLDNIEKVGKQKNLDWAQKWLDCNVKNIIDAKPIKDNKPLKSVQKNIKNNDFKLQLNNYVQLVPRHVHSISKHIAGAMNDNNNMIQMFDMEILSIQKDKKHFIVQCENDKFICKKIILCAGRSGWRWTKQLFENFNLLTDNNLAKFGIRVELPCAFMQEFNGSNCTIYNDEFEIGPISWNGSVIPEDHVDMVISAFRSNEDRWRTDKVSFNLLCKQKFENSAAEQINRIGQLTWILSNDRVIKEKISMLMTKKSKISIMPEYDWLPEAIETVSGFMPNLTDHGYFHVPTIIPANPKVKLTKNFESKVDNLFCAGESAGYSGLLFAMLSGILAADGAIKGL